MHSVEDEKQLLIGGRTGAYLGAGQKVTTARRLTPEEVALFVRLNRNSRIQAGLTIATTLLAVLGSFALLLISGQAGLHDASSIFRGWLATFDYANVLFMILFGSALTGLRVHDGTHHQLSFRTHRPRRTRWSSATIFLGFFTLSVLWGELALRPVLSGRAQDPRYIEAARWPEHPISLTDGVVVLLVGYYLLMGIILLIHLVGMRFNPVDGATYHLALTTALPGRDRKRYR